MNGYDSIKDIKLLPAVNPLGIALVLFSLVMNSLEVDKNNDNYYYYFLKKVLI